MSKKKTVSLAKMIQKVNELNKSPHFSPETRRGWNMLLEQQLVDNDVYAGFNYYSADSLPPNTVPGIIRHPSHNEFPDETRIFYYTHNYLKEKESHSSR